MDAQVIDLTCCSAGVAGASDFKRSRSKLLQSRRSSPHSARDRSRTRSHQGESSSSSRNISEMPSAITSPQGASRLRSNHRFPGDGLDYRRPANLSNVVDLTGSDDESNDNDDVQITSVNDTGGSANSTRPSNATLGQPRPAHRPQHRTNRGPRFAQRIIHDDDDTGDSHVPHFSRRVDQRSSARIQGLSSRTLPPLQTQTSAAAPFGYVVNQRPEIIEIDDDEDEAMLRTQLLRNQQSGRNLLENIRQPHVSHAMAVFRAMQAHVNVPLQDWVSPMMDYTRAAFSMAYPAAPAYRNAPPRAASPAYEDLPPVADGFTRSPRDGDALICPLCEGELCIGDGEARSQVWVVRSCGHVYCGDCAQNRVKGRATKKAKPGSLANERKFTNCVVPNCNEKVTGAKAMYQLFL